MSKSADAFRTISEVADWLGVQTHVLRFWESKFTQVKPVKRAGGRRYYRPVDMLLLGGIRKLLHDDGLTIKGVQKVLREKGIAHVSTMSHGLDEISANIPADMPTAQGSVKAPLEDAERDDVGNVVSLTAEAPIPPAQPEQPRPSFTQDAVVMPEDAADESSGAASTPANPTPPVEADEADAHPAFGSFTESSADKHSQTTTTQSPAPPVSAAAEPEKPEMAPVSPPPEVDSAPSPQATEEAAAPEPLATPPAAEVTPIDPEPSTKPFVETSSHETPESNEDAASPSEPEAEAEEEDPQPMFRASSRAADEAADPDTPAPSQDAVVADADPETPVPSFMHRTRTAPMMPPMPELDEPAPADEATTEPSVEMVDSAPAEPEPVVADTPAVPEPPKPILLDVPETPDESTFPAQPAALSAVMRAKRVTDAVSARAVLDQLTALRDRMTAARKE